MKETILIVDDEKHICSVLADYLRDEHYTVYEANDLATARLHLKKALLPDLVVLDVMLGDGNGIVFVREMRESAHCREIPVIMMSAHRTKSEDKVLGLEFGADDYLTKPFDLRELHLRIEKILKSSRRDLARQNEEKIPQKQGMITDDVNSALQGVLDKRNKPASIQKIKQSEGEKKPKAPPPYRGIHVGKLFLKLLLEPTSFLHDVSPALLSWMGLSCLILAGVLRGFQDGIAEKSIAVGFMSLIVYPLANATLAAVLAWSLQWSLGLRQKSAPFNALFGAIALGFGPLVLSSFLGILYTAFTSGRAGDFTAGLLLVLPSQASSKFIGPLLRRVDLFELWAVWLAGSALHLILQGPKKKIYQWSFGIWCMLIGVLVLAKGFFS